MSRFASRPLDDPTMWRRLLGRLHLDAGGGHEEFVWAQAVREAVAKHASLPPPAPSPARAPHDRIRYTGRFPRFTAHTEIILTFAPNTPPWAVRLLDLLADCTERGTADERAGATLRHVGHMLGRLAHAP
jgi:hypothetical protein